MTSWAAVKRNFLAGLILLLPLLITLYILQVLAGFIFRFINPLVQTTDLAQYTANVELVAQIVTVLIILVFVSALGYVAQRPIGQKLFVSLDRVVSVVPVARIIYSTVQQVADSFSGSETSYKNLVLIEYPRKGIYSIGLVTSESPKAVNDVAGKPVRNVFLPSTPNPAGGRLVLVPEDDIHEVDLSVRQGMQILMTTGVNATDDDISAPELLDDIPAEDEMDTDWGLTDDTPVGEQTPSTQTPDDEDETDPEDGATDTDRDDDETRTDGSGQ